MESFTATPHFAAAAMIAFSSTVSWSDSVEPWETDETEFLCSASDYDMSGARISAISSRFEMLRNRWERDVGMRSLPQQLLLHPAYQEIIGMGRDALPLIFDELKKKPTHWTWALAAITGAQPVRENASYREAVEDWLNWGKTQGYV